MSSNKLKIVFLAPLFTLMISTLIGAQYRLERSALGSLAPASVVMAENPNSPFQMSSGGLSTYALTLSESDGLYAISDGEEINFDDIEPEIIGKALPYPNPFRPSDTIRIGYQLSKPMDIDLYVYSSFGFMVFYKHFNAGEPNGGSGTDYNKVDLRANGLNTSILSSGLYFYVIMNNGKLLGRGKMVMLP